MSDERLRELDRRWRASGTVDDEAALLAERMRAGVLTPEKLSSAALLGSRAAMLTQGDSVLIEPWTNALADQEIAVRAALLILGDLCRELALSPPPSIIEMMVEVARAWLAASTRGSVAGWPRLVVNNCHAQAADHHARGDVRVAHALELAEAVGLIIESGVAVGVTELVSVLAEYHHLYLSLQAETVRATLIRGVVPWILGHNDPLNIDTVKEVT